LHASQVRQTARHGKVRLSAPNDANTNTAMPATTALPFWPDIVTDTSACEQLQSVGSAIAGSAHARREGASKWARNTNAPKYRNFVAENLARQPATAIIPIDTCAETPQFNPNLFIIIKYLQHTLFDRKFARLAPACACAAPDA
jgi:hypothetical protein